MCKGSDATGFAKKIVIGFRHKNIYNAGSVGTLPLYLYLNKKYAHLAEPLASVLKQMKQNQKIIADFNRGLLHLGKMDADNIK